MLLSSISKKLFLALTGLALCGFVSLHLAGNFALYGSEGVYNQYGHMLRTNPLLIPGEATLAALFLAHMALAIWVTLENRAARKFGNSEVVKAGESTLASATMIISGLVVVAFLVLHLKAFRFPDHLPVVDAAVPAADQVANLRKLVIDHLSQPAAFAWYLIAVCILGLHLRHALQSSLRTLGIFSAGRWHYVDRISIAFGVVIAAGYASIPLWIYIGRPAA